MDTLVFPSTLMDNRTLLLAGAALAAITTASLFSTASRPKVIPTAEERVLILGASSGIGQALAHLYASRKARICLVARRAELLDRVVQECEALAGAPHSQIIKCVEDFSDPEGLLRIRGTLEHEMGGIDTVIVNAGVSSLKPLLAVAGVELPQDHLGSDGLRKLQGVAAAAMNGNFFGPMLSTVAFLPLLIKTSKSPSVALISTVAATIPAPTRTLYAASKGAALLLHQALSIEHPAVTFTSVLPATIEGDFRSSAVDGGPVRENLSHGLKKEYVAKECAQAIDGQVRTLWLPWYYRFAHLLYWIMPNVVDHGARKKYNYT